MIFDKTGRRIKPGMIVDIPTSGMMTCVVMSVDEGDILLPNGQPTPPRIIVQPMPCALNVGKNQANNLVAPEVYIVKQEVPDESNGGTKPGPVLVS